MPAPDLPVAAAIRRPAWSQFCRSGFYSTSFGQKAAPVAAFDAAPARPVLHATRVPFRQARRPAPPSDPALYFVPLRLSQASGRGVTGSAPAAIRPAAPRQRSSGARAACRSRPSLQRQYPVACRRTARGSGTASGYRAWTNAIQAGGRAKAGGFYRRTCANAGPAVSPPA